MVEEEEEPAAPAQHVGTHTGPEQPVVEEELVVSNKSGKNKRAVKRLQDLNKKQGSHQ